MKKKTLVILTCNRCGEEVFDYGNQAAFQLAGQHLLDQHRADAPKIGGFQMRTEEG